MLLYTLVLAQAQFTEDFAGQSTVIGWLDTLKDQAKFNNPHGMDIAPDGTIYVADRFNHLIRKIDVNGELTTLAGTGESGNKDGNANEAQFFEPWDVSAGNDGEVYVADAKNNKIRVITPDGQVSTYAGTGNAGFTDHRSPLISSFFWPSGVEFDHATGELYVAGHLSHLIRKILPSGQVITFAGTKEGFPNNFGHTDGELEEAQFYRPYGLHLAKDGALYVADEWNSLIRKISPDGSVSTLGGKAEMGGYVNGGKDTSLFNYPWDLTTDATGNLYVIDGYNHVIRKIDIEEKVTTLFAGKPNVTGAANGALLSSAFNGATGIEYHEGEGSLYIADAFNHVIRRIDLLEDIHLSWDSTSLCEGDSVSIHAFPTYYASYKWYKNNEYVSSTTLPTYKYIASENAIWTVVGSKTGVGKAYSDSLTIAVESAQSITIDEEIFGNQCVGDSILLTTTNPVLWNDETTSTNYMVKKEGWYTASINSGACFVGEDSVYVDFYPLPEVVLSVYDTSIYVGETVIVEAKGATSYEWSDGSLSSAIELSDEGSYELVGFSEHNCPSDRVKVNVSYLEEIEAIDDVIYLPYQTEFSADILSNDNYPEDVTISLLSKDVLEQFYIENQELQLYNTQIYNDTVLYTNYQICNTDGRCDKAKLTIHVTGVGYALNGLPYFPEGFSPNGDGINDVFQILGLYLIPDNSLAIYNRWGQLVYETTDYQDNWNGQQNNGGQLPEGTYFYQFTDLSTQEIYDGYVILKK